MLFNSKSNFSLSNWSLFNYDIVSFFATVKLINFFSFYALDYFISDNLDVNLSTSSLRLLKFFSLISVFFLMSAIYLSFLATFPFNNLISSLVSRLFFDYLSFASNSFFLSVSFFFNFSASSAACFLASDS